MFWRLPLHLKCIAAILSALRNPVTMAAGADLITILRAPLATRYFGPSTNGSGLPMTGSRQYCRSIPAEAKASLILGKLPHTVRRFKVMEQNGFLYCARACAYLRTDPSMREWKEVR